MAVLVSDTYTVHVVIIILEDSGTFAMTPFVPTLSGSCQESTSSNSAPVVSAGTQRERASLIQCVYIYIYLYIYIYTYICIYIYIHI